jgi:3-oxo-5,6-didehydrosuberyl-CoA/3-oxoadipyl-CoA thiolase
MVWDGVHDECVRGGLREEDLARLRPLYGQGGTITAGNASALSDGASAAILMREDKARALGLTPLAIIKATATSAVDPAGELLIAPVTALPRALDRAGLTLADLALLDLHEAFAAQVLAVTRALGLPDDAAHVNPNGGAIALGHPLGASGARLAGTAALELAARGGRLALATMCIGVGQGIALALQRA